MIKWFKLSPVDHNNQESCPRPMIEVIFGAAAYDRPGVYEAGLTPRNRLRNRNETGHFDAV